MELVFSVRQPLWFSNPRVSLCLADVQRTIIRTPEVYLLCSQWSLWWQFPVRTLSISFLVPNQPLPPVLSVSPYLSL